MSVLIVHRNTLFGSESTMVGNGIAVNVVTNPSLTQPTPSCTVLEKATNGLPLLIVCSKAIPYGNRLKS
ncbi:hypothetical protein HNR53_004413 [Bacillus benzoevorans]|uniref:Uncharacterized protein n=1 Tax=Bacillus benzoevorans TaxID=1456 RepID=A0A7X0LYR2_9BACI|nr:hypothetical protein [Bacillus benzoevorans]